MEIGDAGESYWELFSEEISWIFEANKIHLGIAWRKPAGSVFLLNFCYVLETEGFWDVFLIGGFFVVVNQMWQASWK